ncbi:MAG TPA: OmpA family protein [Steroidobacteraceae bacterium]|nr:OmpA family protein [Steroidobacteraceae bacterium]
MSILSNKVRVATVGITVAAISLAALPASASQTPAAGAPQAASKQENIGILTGAAVGAAAGGPVGAVVGMVAGALLGNHYHKQSVANHDLTARNRVLMTQNQALATSLSQTQQDREALAGKLDIASQSLTAVQAQRAELDRTVQLSDDVETDVAFRTAADSINGMQLPALRKIGALAAALPPGAKVRIDGYADPRGPATFNDNLSLRRAEAVALTLEKAGCPQDKLVIAGHGSAGSTSPKGDLDAYAFDRRVTVRLEGVAVAQSAAAEPAVADAR